MGIPNLVAATDAAYLMSHMDSAASERFADDQRRRWMAQCELHDGHTSRANAAFYEAYCAVSASVRSSGFETAPARGSVADLAQSRLRAIPRAS
jgi:hypothetical protein